MSIRIIGGTLKRRNIKTPSAFTAELRPTASRVRESLFNILANQFEGKNVLDLFAGMGCLGIEALSRGAAFATFVEKEFKHAKILSENIKELDLEKQTKVIVAPLPRALANLQGPFDFIFIDPPYEKNLEIEVLEQLPKLKLMHEQTVIIVEQSRHSVNLWPVEYREDRTHRVGDTNLCFLKPESPKP